jgi:hypothetical protein
MRSLKSLGNRLLTIEEVHSSSSLPYVRKDLSSNLQKGLLKSLFDYHSVQGSWQQNFLVLWRVWVVGTALPGHQSEEFA